MIIIWVSVGLMIGAIGIVLLSVLAIEIYIRVKRHRDNIELMAITQNIKSHYDTNTRLST